MTATLLVIVVLVMALPSVSDKLRSEVEVLARLIANGLILLALALLLYALASHGRLG